MVICPNCKDEIQHEKSHYITEDGTDYYICYTRKRARTNRICPKCGEVDELDKHYHETKEGVFIKISPLAD